VKKLFLTILLLLNSVSLSFGAIASTTVWEVRTTGDATNGGGFNASRTSAGTDYSQQDTAQLALTDLASTSASSWLTLTSATGGFTAKMIGNIIYIASGTNFTPGYYEITAYTDTNTVTVDRACGATGDATSGAGKVGGAVNHPYRIAPNMSSGNKMYIKSGTYYPIDSNAFVLQTNVVGDTGGRSTEYIGYDTSRTVIPIGENRPILDATIAGEPDTYATNALSMTNWGGQKVSNIIFQNASSSGTAGSHSWVYTYFNCLSRNNGGHGFAGADLVITIMCESYGNGDVGFFQTVTRFSYSHDNSGLGGYYYLTGRSGSIGSIFDSNSLTGVKIYNEGDLIGNLSYNNVTYGFEFYGDLRYHGFLVANNLALSNGSRGFSNSGNNKYWFLNNGSYGNGAADLNFDNQFKVTTNPLLTDPASGDFTLQSSSPLIGAGLDLSTFTSLTTDFNVNIGIDQNDYTSYSYGFSN